MTGTEYVRYGIDLGTTNSCIARADGADVRVYANNDQMSVTPSVVRLLKTGRIITGKRAYNAFADDPDNIALEFKRVMGQKGGKDFPAAGRSMTADALSAEILKALRDDVARADGAAPIASVVTVPAAFGALQCDATARACSLAGLVQAPLLQEPIAAAIAYGLAPGSRDQRWLVFDLGGGTLDIAVVSTRDGRLTVLDHRGHNLLGGKDFDRRIARELLLPPLQKSFRLPDLKTDAAKFERLMRRLVLKAEEAKIDLSSLDRVVVSLIDLGEDQEGKAIELEVTLTRADVEREIEPIVERALRLAEEALVGARMEGKDLDRILLVGGPTQTPYVRSAIRARLNAEIDFSVDPMTVVARGAALYAATVELEHVSVAPAAAAVSGAAGTTPNLKLVYEPVSAKLSTVVAGKVEGASERIAEVRIDTEGGYWTSGWVPLASGVFETAVMLQEGKASRFFLYARDAAGNLIDVAPNEFAIRHGLVVSAPPLPHTIGIEVARAGGKSEIDPIFKRGSPLPAETTVKYRADRSCKPGDATTSLAIKLREGEEFSDAEANVWLGNMRIDATGLRRMIPEGSEIELTVKIDASRLITVEAFVKHLNEHFTDRLYVAEEGQLDFVDLSSEVPDQVAEFRERLEELESAIPEGSGGEAQREKVKKLRSELDELDEEAGGGSDPHGTDPDQAKRVVEQSRSVRSKLSSLEKASGVDRQQSAGVTSALIARDRAKDVAERFGTDIDKTEAGVLEKQLDRALKKADERDISRTAEALDGLKWRVLFAQDWYWREMFISMQGPDHAYVNRAEAERCFKQGDAAIKAGDGEELRKVVRELWKLQPAAAVEQDKERAIRSGLRRF